ncbi:MAG: hypothetical protein ACOZIN_07740 [Myxococcota bacterium]
MATPDRFPLPQGKTTRKPEWLKVRLPHGEGYERVKAIVAPTTLATIGTLAAIATFHFMFGVPHLAWDEPGKRFAQEGAPDVALGWFCETGSCDMLVRGHDLLSQPWSLGLIAFLLVGIHLWRRGPCWWKAVRASLLPALILTWLTLFTGSTLNDSEDGCVWGAHRAGLPAFALFRCVPWTPNPLDGTVTLLPLLVDGVFWLTTIALASQLAGVARSRLRT